MLVTTLLRPLIGAHRGASADAPENTFSSFDLALAQGAELLECDVHLTADDHLAVLHDFTLRRVAGSDIAVRASTLAQLRDFDVGAWRGAAWAGQRVPVLEDVLERYADRAFINVEIKAPRVPYPLIEAAVARAIRMRGIYNGVIVSSFDRATLTRLRHIDPKVHAALLADTRPDEALLTAREEGLVGVHLRASLITEARMRRIRSWGLGVLAWTVDEIPEMQRLSALDVDAIVSDYPAVLRDVVLARRESGR